MSTNGTPFGELLEAARAELHAIAPGLTAPRLAPTVTALAAIIALCRCRLSVRRRANRLAASILCQPAPEGCLAARELLDLAEEAVNTSFDKPDKTPAFPLDQWIEQHGFLPLVTALVGMGVAAGMIHDVAQRVADYVRTLGDEFRRLGAGHRAAIVKRDLGGDLPCTPGHGFSPVMHWALARDFAGKPERKQVLTRRRQALDAYGAIASVLLEPGVTRTIDQGLPLNRCLSDRLGVDEAHLRRLRGLRSGHIALTQRGDFMAAVKTLLSHEVPLHQWPGNCEWEGSVWRDARSDHLLRPDYISGSTERRDAFEALKDDLLKPLAAERAAALGLGKQHAVRYFVSSLVVPQSLAHGEQHRLWLRALRTAIIGPRGLASFDEAARRWHRRAATVAALRHEEKAETPGWPPLCPDWRSPDGAYSLVALSTAQDLVAEGNALDHCVGGYYSHCRTGETQILSLRTGEHHCATLELLVQPVEDGVISLQVGQFKGRRNVRPEPSHREAVRAFLEDLRAGRHPVFAREIREYRRKMARACDYGWASGPLPLDHSRRAWPLNRTFLPKGAPDAFDAWCEASGLKPAFDAMLIAVASPAR